MSEPQLQTSTLPIGYAVPAPRGPSVAAGVWVAIIGLVLIFFGGCFVIGILIQVYSDGPGMIRPWQGRDYLLHIVLYGLAGGCFAGGAVLIMRGVKSLLGIARSAQP